MQYSQQVSGDSCKVVMTGKFTREDSGCAQQIFNFIKEQEPKEMLLDMAGLTFIDSSALGQLLLFREAIQEVNGAIILQGPVGHVRDMLRIGNFYELFLVKE